LIKTIAATLVDKIVKIAGEGYLLMDGVGDIQRIAMGKIPVAQLLVNGISGFVVTKVNAGTDVKFIRDIVIEFTR